MTQPISARRQPTPAEIITQALAEGASLSLDVRVHMPDHLAGPVTVRLASSHHTDLVALAARQFADLIDLQPEQPPCEHAKVPEYAQAVASALVAARKRLEGPLPIAVRPAVEQEAKVLGTTLGSILARQYLEAMGVES